MLKLENFINENLNEFSLLENSEVKDYSIDEIDKDIVDYLIKICDKEKVVLIECKEENDIQDNYNS